jgi:hypothetical protein
MRSCSHGSYPLVNLLNYQILTISFILLAMINGCATLPNGRGWGQDATLSPGWNRMKQAAIGAILSLETWAPVGTALILQVDDMDKRLSNWASGHTPIFGSQESADRWSDYLRESSGAAYLITALAAPSGNDPIDWAKYKIKGIAMGVGAWGLTAGATDLLKTQTGRTRPDMSDKSSFPSGHVSTTGSFTTLAGRNIRTLPLSPRNSTLARIGLAGMAAGTAWARIEAKRHYPSDVLVGYALGHFMSAFINDAFLGPDIRRDTFFLIQPTKGGMVASVRFAY